MKVTPKLTNTTKLKAKLLENNFTQEKIADKIDISQQTFNTKLNNKAEFKASEIKALCKLLHISDKDEYFFCDCDSQNG
ncbi:MAG: helix-turn-helix domain-containing protein [Candidatus Fimenecus sp.]